MSDRSVSKITARRERTSRVQESVLDEDSYTDALSHIIARDFFPQLPHLHATNAYLSALSSRDPELLSASIRRLAALSKEQEARFEGNASAGPSVPRPSLTAPTPRTHRHRTPIGSRYFDTPDVRYRSQSPVDATEADGSLRPAKRNKTSGPVQRAQDLSLNDFQRVFTSEDNASFADIMDEENLQNREKWSWAWEAEEKARVSRLKLESRRERLLLEAKGSPTEAPPLGALEAPQSANPAVVTSDFASTALVTTDPQSTSRTVVLRSEIFATDPSADPILLPTSPLRETPLDPSAPLTKALQAAGLPGTALTDADGLIVPAREMASGAGDSRGRGEEERLRRLQVESSVMDVSGQKDLRPNGIGAGSQGWGYKARNALMYPADADAPANNTLGSSYNLDPESTRQDPPRVIYSNTAIPDRTMKSGTTDSVPASSPTRSLVAAAVSGTKLPSSVDDPPAVGSYNLLPVDASPSPAELPDLLTWGTLMATPRPLGHASDPTDGRTFRLPETQRRDRLAKKLADDASRSMRMRAKGYGQTSIKAVPKPARGTGSMPPPATPRRSASSLTPAARKLLERSSRTPAPLSRHANMAADLDTPAHRRDRSSRGWTLSPARPL